VSASSWLGLDLSPLRVSAAFRRIFAYRLIGVLANQAAYVAVVYQLTQITNSTIQVAALGVVELVPIVVFGLWGGVIADHFDRRRVVIVCEIGLLVVAAALLVNSRVAHPSVAVIYAAAGLNAAFGSFMGPSIAAILQQVVPHDLQRQASTISMTGNTLGSIVGPAIGGLVAATLGAWVVYAGNAVSFALTLGLLVGLRVPERVASTKRADMAALREGARYAKSRPDVLGTYVIDLLAMFLAFPVSIFAFAARGYHSPYALSLLFAALPAGAFIASVTPKWSARVHHYGRAVTWSATLWGLGIALFGASHYLWLAIVGLVIAGGADAVSGIFRQAMWNESIPPVVRGRMAGIELLSYAVGPTIGQARAGFAASWMGLRASIVTGGLACSTLCAGVGMSLRSLWDFDRRSDLHVADVERIRAAEALDG
jgi:MFS family permease